MNRGIYIYEDVCTNQDETHHRTRFWMHATFKHTGKPDIELFAGLPSTDVIIQQDWVMMKNEDEHEQETVFVCEVWVLNNDVQATCDYIEKRGFTPL